MVELDTLLNLDRETKMIDLTKNQKIIIKYLLNLQGKRLFIEEMAKKTGLAKVTIYNNLEKLQKERIIYSSWKIDPFALDFKIIEVEAYIERPKEAAAINKLSKHLAISSINKCFNNNLRINVIVRHIDYYKEIEKYLEKIGFKIRDSKILIKRVHET